MLTNLQILTQTRFDSGALGGLGVVVHRLVKPGNHRITVLQEDKPVETLSLRVLQTPGQSSAGPEPRAAGQPSMAPGPSELHVDLGRVLGRPGDLTPEPSVSPLEMSAQGYAVFHAPPGSTGFAVQIHPAGAENQPPAFDSRQLNENDLFATTLLRPGRYSLTNAATGAKGEIRVSYPVVGDTPYRPPDPFEVHVTDAGFQPGSIQLKPAQGLIFHIQKTRARIQIDLVEPDDGPAGTGGEGLVGPAPRFRWEKPRRPGS